MNYEPLPQRLLMGPGPSNVNARVLQAMALPTIGHLDPAFTALMDETMEMLWVYAGPTAERIVVEESCATLEGNPWR